MKGLQGKACDPAGERIWVNAFPAGVSHACMEHAKDAPPHFKSKKDGSLSQNGHKDTTSCLPVSPPPP